MADISLQITGDNTGLIRALEESRAAVQSATSEIKGHFESITGVFEKVSGALAAFSAVLAGGAAFKDAIDATVDLTVGAVTLGRQFGISATQASDLRVALGEVHVTTETFSAAGNALVKTLNKNEAAFNEVGIATRTSGGELRNQMDILLDVTDHLAKLKEGTDRNIEGQRFFGRAWAEVAPVVKVTSEILREAGEKAAALGLEVGGEQVAATQRYRAAMNDVHEVMEGIKNAIGQAVMPALTKLGEWFGTIGPGTVEAFRIALTSLEAAFRFVVLGIEVVYQTGKVVFTDLAEYANTFGQVIALALRGDFSGAAQAWRAGMGRIEQVGNEYWDKIAKDAQDAQDKIVAGFANAIVGPKVTPTAAGDGGSAADSEAKNKKEMELIREKMRLDDQAAQLRLKQIDTGLTESDLKLSAEEREQAAGRRAIDLIKEEMRADDLNAASRLKGISTGLEESDRYLKGQERMLKSVQQKWAAVTDAMSSAMASSLRGMLTGAMSFGDAMRNMFASIAEAAVQQAAKNIATMVMQSAVGGGIRSAEIRKDAGAAAAGAYKAIVGIPYVGPFLAPAAAAVAYAGVLAFDSAERGYDIPAGVNPMTQLHEREMVLPAPIADAVRDKVDGGGVRAVHIHGRRNDVFTADQLASMLKELGHRFVLS